MLLVQPSEIFVAGDGKASYQLLDVRAPIEVERGALPNSVFEPILTNEERHEVGLCYRHKGQQAAIELGYELTTPYLPERIAAWRKACETAPSAVMCWRGGLRSKLTCEFIARGDVPRVAGGYKALRNYLLSQLEPRLKTKQVSVLTGLTGSGKTNLLRELRGQSSQLDILDLEAEAHHRGSAFGKLDAQPSQASFENSIAVQILLSGQNRLIIEDESRGIGRLRLPGALYKAMSFAPLIRLEASLKERMNHIFDEYVRSSTESRGQVKTQQHLESGILKLYQRLGWKTVKLCLESLEEARQSGKWLEPSAHYVWIAILLNEYYDPLYQKAMKQNDRPVLFSGTYQQCLEYLAGSN
ncbi:MAG: tRNA 2-selenouridine(34) synthase MnmH [Trueperaceae bacterium]|nr:tRNA 2-selenouridine(34) synthase MnmH [Trueperaceae bacterium]